MTRTDEQQLSRLRKLERASLAASGLLRWQSRLLESACDPRVSVAMATAPRGGGKSLVCGRLALEFLGRSGRLHEKNGVGLVCAASLTQAALVTAALRRMEGADRFQFRASGRVEGDDGAVLRVLSSDARRALGLGAERLILCDEPSGWLPAMGPALWDAIIGSIGKREGRTIVLAGTRHPAVENGTGGWWLKLLSEPLRSGWKRYALQARDPGKWWRILQANPFAACFPKGPMAAALKREWAESRDDPELLRKFEADRCNTVSEPPGVRVLDADEIETVLARPVPPPGGEPITGVDMGSTQGLSAAAVFYPTARRIDVRAVSPAGVSFPGAVPSAGHVPLPGEVLPLRPGLVVADLHRGLELESAVIARGGSVRFRPAYAAVTCPARSRR